MNVGEAAAHAVVLALQENVQPASVNVNGLQMELADHRIAISFFNDINVAGPEAWIPALQFLGDQGVFPILRRETREGFGPRGQESC